MVRSQKNVRDRFVGWDQRACERRPTNRRSWWAGARKPTMGTWCLGPTLRLCVVPAVATALFAPFPAAYAADDTTSAAGQTASPPSLAETGPKPKPVPKADPKEIEASIDRGVAFLLKRQNANGSWGSERSDRPGEVYAPVPGAHQAFRGAVTSLCISALLEVGGPSPDVQRSVDRAEVWLMEHLPAVRRSSADKQDLGDGLHYAPATLYNNWCHAYSIDALLHMLRRHPQDKEHEGKIRALIDQQIGMLVRYECLSGGWCYYDDVRVPDAASQRFHDQLRDRHGAGGDGRRPRRRDPGSAEGCRSRRGLDCTAAEA